MPRSSDSTVSSQGMRRKSNVVKKNVRQSNAMDLEEMSEPQSGSGRVSVAGEDDGDGSSGNESRMILRSLMLSPTTTCVSNNDEHSGFETDSTNMDEAENDANFQRNFRKRNRGDENDDNNGGGTGNNTSRPLELIKFRRLATAIQLYNNKPRAGRVTSESQAESVQDEVEVLYSSLDKPKNQSVQTNPNSTDQELLNLYRQVAALTAENKALHEQSNSLKQKNEELSEQIQNLNRESSVAREEWKKKLAEVVETELKCGVCREVVVKPVTWECGHMFCSTCIVSWFRQHAARKSCPTCRKHWGRNQVELKGVEGLVNSLYPLMPTEAQYSRQELVNERSRNAQSEQNSGGSDRNEDLRADEDFIPVQDIPAAGEFDFDIVRAEFLERLRSEFGRGRPLARRSLSPDIILAPSSTNGTVGSSRSIRSPPESLGSSGILSAASVPVDSFSRPTPAASIGTSREPSRRSASAHTSGRSNSGEAAGSSTNAVTAAPARRLNPVPPVSPPLLSRIPSFWLQSSLALPTSIISAAPPVNPTTALRPSRQPSVATMSTSQPPRAHSTTRYTSFSRITSSTANLPSSITGYQGCSHHNRPARPQTPSSTVSLDNRWSRLETPSNVSLESRPSHLQTPSSDSLNNSPATLQARSQFTQQWLRSSHSNSIDCTPSETSEISTLATAGSSRPGTSTSQSASSNPNVRFLLRSPTQLTLPSFSQLADTYRSSLGRAPPRLRRLDLEDHLEFETPSRMSRAEEANPNPSVPSENPRPVFNWANMSSSEENDAAIDGRPGSLVARLSFECHQRHRGSKRSNRH